MPSFLHITRHQARWALQAGLRSLLAVVALWFVGWVLIGDRLLLVRWGAYVAPWLALLVLIAALFFGIARTWAWCIASALLALLIASPILGRFNPARLHEARAGDLRVMTFNTSDLNTDYRAMAAVIAREHPDIVFIQQLRDLSALERALASLHVARYDAVPRYLNDVIILSRFPLSDVQAPSHILSAVVAAGACRIRLWDLHAPHGQTDIDTQALYFRQAAQAMSTETLPVILGGDFNSTEFNSDQAALRDQLADAYAAKGFGPGFTFPSRVRRFGMFGRLFRIDHILARGMIPTAAWVPGDSANSDHFPVMAAFRRCGT